MIIKKAAIKYAESYGRAVDAVARERRFLLTTEGFSLESTQEFVKYIEEQNLAQYYAVANNEVAGWCDVLPRPQEGRQHVGVLGMGLLPSWRGKGIGTQLLIKSIEHAKGLNNLEKVELEVFESNLPAVRFYEKMGFSIEGRRVKSRKLDGVYDNIILMGKFI